LTFAAGLLAGVMLAVSWPALAATAVQFAVSVANYPVFVNDVYYENDTEAPILNVNGRTYVPLRAVSEMLGADVQWHDAQRVVEIRLGEQPPGNSAFRIESVLGENGRYTVIGKARVFEAVMHYAVSDGHDVLDEQMVVLDAGAPAWAPFELNIEIPKEKLPVNGTLMVELFEYSAKDGSRVNEWFVVLEKFES